MDPRRGMQEGNNNLRKRGDNVLGRARTWSREGEAVVGRVMRGEERGYGEEREWRREVSRGRE